MQDNGNVEVLRDTRDGSETVEWTSDTQGTDCTQAFVPDSTRIELAARVESSDADAANVVRDNVCSLFKVEAYESGEFSQDIAANTAGPAVLRGRTVINEYKLVLTGFYGGLLHREVPNRLRTATEDLVLRRLQGEQLSRQRSRQGNARG